MGEQRKTIKEKLLEGRTLESLVEEGHCKSSVRKAMSELQNGYGVGKPGRKKHYAVDDVSIPVEYDPYAKSTDEQYRILACAVIRLAVSDLARCYVQENKKFKYGKYNSNWECESKSLEKWFRDESPNFTNISPEVLIQAAKHQAEIGLPNTHATQRFIQSCRDPYTTSIDNRRKEHKNG